MDTTSPTIKIAPYVRLAQLSKLITIQFQPSLLKLRNIVS